MVRVALLLLVGLSAWAQELEEYTLTDGRVIVGNYDPQTKRMQARVGTGAMGFALESEKIVSRRPYVVPPKPVPVVTEATPPPPPEPPKKVEWTPLIAPDVLAKEVEVWHANIDRAQKVDEAARGAWLLKKQFEDLNPVSTAMLKAVKQERTRFRCFIQLADPPPRHLELYARSRWILIAFDAEGKAFAWLMARRDEQVGSMVAEMLKKEPFAAAHLMLSTAGTLRETFDIDMILADNWNPVGLNVNSVP